MRVRYSDTNTKFPAAAGNDPHEGWGVSRGPKGRSRGEAARARRRAKRAAKLKDMPLKAYLRKYGAR